MPRKSGRHPLAIGREMAALMFGRSRLTAAEYVLYGFHDRARYNQQRRDEFISGRMHGKIVWGCMDMRWWKVANDKWLNAAFLAADATPPPETLAVIDRSPRPGRAFFRSSAPGGRGWSERRHSKGGGPPTCAVSCRQPSPARNVSRTGTLRRGKPPQAVAEASSRRQARTGP